MKQERKKRQAEAKLLNKLLVGIGKYTMKIKS